MKETQFSPEEAARKIASDLATAEDCVRASVAGVDAEMAFAAYAFYRIISDPVIDEPRYSRPTPVAMELAAWILYPEFGKSVAPVDPRMDKIIDALENLGRCVSLSEVFIETPDPPNERDLAVHLRLHSGLVRGSSYPQQALARIGGVLRPLETPLRDIVGIGPYRACEIVIAIHRLLVRKVRELMLKLQNVSEKGRGRPRVEASRADNHQIQSEDVSFTDARWIPDWHDVAESLPDLMRGEWDALRKIIGLTPNAIR